MITCMKVTVIASIDKYRHCIQLSKWIVVLESLRDMEKMLIAWFLPYPH